MEEVITSRNINPVVIATEITNLKAAEETVRKDVLLGRAKPGPKGWVRARALALIDAKRVDQNLGVAAEKAALKARQAAVAKAKKEDFNEFFFGFMMNPAFRSRVVEHFILDEENGTVELFISIEMNGKTVQARKTVSDYSRREQVLVLRSPPGSQYFGSGGYSCGLRGSENVDEGKPFSNGFISGRNNFRPVDLTQPAWLLTGGMSCMSSEGEEWNALSVYIPGWGWL